MKKPGVVLLALILGLGAAGLALAQLSPKPTEGQWGSIMGPGMMGMMVGGQMDQMMPMMQACAQMMNQMSPMMGQPGTPQQQPPQPEKQSGCRSEGTCLGP